MPPSGIDISIGFKTHNPATRAVSVQLHLYIGVQVLGIWEDLMGYGSFQKVDGLIHVADTAAEYAVVDMGIFGENLNAQCVELFLINQVCVVKT